ncbi:MAG: nucleotidyltransferase domain-containing protein [candidate division KSB1 bacterium]|nr:nucleotidyltransferase domain-containing protein [candidate division KSB1 bacterium]
MIQSAYIFGSQVGGRRHHWSDIDVCVVSSNFGPRNDGISYLWRALRPQDVKAGIEPVGFHPDEFTDDIPLVHEIIQHGVRII